MLELQPFALTLASLAAGCGVGLAALIVSRIIYGRRPPYDTFEQSRRQELRNDSGTYRNLNRSSMN